MQAKVRRNLPRFRVGDPGSRYDLRSVFRADTEAERFTFRAPRLPRWDESMILCDSGHTENPSIIYEHFGEFIPGATYVEGEREMRDDIIGQIFVVVTLVAAAALLFT